MRHWLNKLLSNPATTGAAPEDAPARRWLCEHLPEIRGNAQRAGWSARLEAELTAVRAGGSAALALDNLRIPWENRGADPVSAAAGFEPVKGPEKFHCPFSACKSKDRTRDGAEPVCHITGQVMNYEP